MKCLLQFYFLILKNGHPALMLAFGFLFTACNSAMPELSGIYIAPVSLSTTNIDVSINRVFLYGTRSDGKEAFARFYTSSPTAELELRTGEWTFYGLAYSGTNISKCSKQTVNLNTNKRLLVLDFQNSKCADEVFLGEDPTLNGSVYPLITFPVTTVEFCESVVGITVSTDECSDDLATPSNRKQPRGHAGSYRYSFHAFEKRGGSYTFNDSIVSTCRNGFPADPSLRGLATQFMGFDVPAGDPNLAPFYIKLEVFPNSTNCTTGTSHFVNLPHGLRSNIPNTKYVVQQAANSIHKLYVKSSGEEICTGLNLTSEFAGGTGLVSDPKLICNETQLYNIFPEGTGSYSAYAQFSYKLLKDLNISSYSIGTNFSPEWQSCVSAGSNFTPIGTLWSAGCSYAVPTNVHFDGGGKTIKGMKIFRAGTNVGLYYALRETVGNSTEIRRLILEDSEINATSIAGSITGDSIGSVFRQITLINPKVTSAGNNIGGLTGTSSGDTFEDITMTNSDIQGGRYAGGVSGSAAYSGVTPTNYTRAFVEGSVYSSAPVSDVGGIVGQIGTINSLSTISESTFSGTVEGGGEVGGLVGLGVALRIENSYVKDTVIKSRDTVAPVVSGGLAGGMNNKFGTSGIYASYFEGSFDHACIANDSSCRISTILGFVGAGYVATDFPSAIYPFSSKIQLSLTNMGYSQADVEFYSTNPFFQNDIPADITGFFSTSIWEFRDGDLPKLKSEP